MSYLTFQLMMLFLAHIQTLNLQETQKKEIGIKDTKKQKQKKLKKSYIAEHKKGFTEIIIQLKQIQNHSVK